MRTLPQWYRDEREKLKGYGPRDRLKYIWQYYRLWIIGIGFAVCFIAYALWNYFTVPGTSTSMASSPIPMPGWVRVPRFTTALWAMPGLI